MKPLHAIVLALVQITASAIGPLTISGHYFTDPSGNAVILTGSHNYYTVQDPLGSSPDFSLVVPFFQSRNQNFTRLWQLDEQEDVSQSSMPFTRPGPGTAIDGSPKWDLTSINSSYLTILSNRVSALNSAGIYCSVMLWNGYDINGQGTYWPTNYYKTGNNINGYVTGTNQVYTANIAGYTNAMTVYVKAVVDTVKGFPNVLYEVGNEMPAWSRSFQEYYITWIKNYEATNSPYIHPVIYSSFDFATDTTGNTWLNASSADAISPYGGFGGSTYSNSPPAVTSGMVQILDSDHIFGGGATTSWVWKSVCRGYSPISMDTQMPTNNVSREPGRASMGYVRRYIDRMKLSTAVPSTTVSSTTYCLSNSILQYLVYSPTTSSFTVALPSGYFSYEWFDPTGGVAGSKGQVKSTGGNVTFTPAFGTDAAIFIGPCSYGGGLEFDGVDDSVNCGSLGNLTGNLTVSAWIFFRSAAVNQRVMDCTSFFFWCEGVGSPTDITFSDATHDSSSASTMSTNCWYHVAATRTSAGVVNLYINGIQSGTANQAQSAPVNASTLYLGNRADKTRCWDGLIRDVRIFSRVLSAGEIKYMATSQNVDISFPTGLTAAWPMTGADATSANGAVVSDRSGGAHSGTGSNGANATGLTWRGGGFFTE